VARFHWLPPLFECAAIAVLIAGSVLHERSILVRPLLSGKLVWLGTVSYSVYVWQQVFFVYRGAAITIPLLCLMPVFALASYYWIELPAARFGRRFADGLKRKVSLDSPGCVSAAPIA
jgi:peptidoglycan/LPS O-acetylase OafA/YrhL